MLHTIQINRTLGNVGTVVWDDETGIVSGYDAANLNEWLEKITRAGSTPSWLGSMPCCNPRHDHQDFVTFIMAAMAPHLIVRFAPPLDQYRAPWPEYTYDPDVEY